MQDGRDEQPRGGATSALEDERTKSAERFGRKSADDPASEPVAASASPATTAPDDSAVEVLEPATISASDQSRNEAQPLAPEAAVGEKPAQESPMAPTESAGDDADAADGMTTVEAEVRMSDGGIYIGTISLSEGERALDLVNSPVPFFELVESSGKVRIMSKVQVLQIIPYEKGTAAGRSGGSLM